MRTIFYLPPAGFSLLRKIKLLPAGVSSEKSTENLEKGGDDHVSKQHYCRSDRVC